MTEISKSLHLVNVFHRFSSHRPDTKEVMTQVGFVIDGCVQNNNGATLTVLLKGRNCLCATLKNRQLPKRFCFNRCLKIEGEME